MEIIHEGDWKLCRSVDYNYDFNKATGYFERWGRTKEDDPVCGPIEICDLEISTICTGIPSPGEEKATPCSFCYKGNTSHGQVMTFETFKTIFDKLPQTLTQIAFGIGNLWTNSKDMFKMFDYCRNNDHNPGVAPNITTNGYGLTPELAEKLAGVLGACAVSVYENKDVCYNAVKMLTDAGMKQINLHMVLAEESYERCFEVVNDIKSDPRLANLNAIVFLTLKPKGERNEWTTLTSVPKYKALIDHAFEKEVGIGFDSCSARTFLLAMKDHPKFNDLAQLSESCESTLFSMYINVEGDFYPCSFTEGERGWNTGISVVNAESFDEVWSHPRTLAFRSANIATTDKSIAKDCRSCVTFPNLYSKVIPIRSIS